MMSRFRWLAAVLAIALRAAAQCPSPQLVSAAYLDANDGFGQAVALDGDVAVVGVPDRAPDYRTSALAIVFERQAGAWREVAQLLPRSYDDPSYFGTSVALDGSTAIVGAPLPGYRGTAYAFERLGGAWSVGRELGASYGPSGGIAVALDGDTAAVGDPSGSPLPAVHVFVRTGSTWSLQATLGSPSSGADGFGAAVALEGDVLVVGAPRDGARGVAAGAAHVFPRSGATWGTAARLEAADAAPGDVFGTQVALSGDVLVVGAPSDATPGGRAIVFRGSGRTWVEQGALVPPPGVVAAHEGRGLAVRPGMIAVGGPSSLVGGVAHGAVHLYRETASGWSPEATITRTPGVAHASFGVAVSMSGQTLLVGAPTVGTAVGEAWFFAACSEADCGDGSDDDVDGDADCDDPGCQGRPGPDGAPCETLIEQSCADGIDNDSDSLADCADPDCGDPGFPPIAATVTLDCPGRPMDLSCGTPAPGVTYTWDLDVATDADGDGDPANDADGSGCDVAAPLTRDVTVRVTASDGSCRTWRDLTVTAPSNAAPAELDGLTISRTGAGVAVSWSPLPALSYARILRGHLAALVSARAYDHVADATTGAGTCDAGSGTSWTDPDDAADPAGFYYLATAVNACSDLEGPCGSGWDGSAAFARPPRAPTASCP